MKGGGSVHDAYVFFVSHMEERMAPAGSVEGWVFLEESVMSSLYAGESGA